jgi:hypothetical protein
MKSKPSGTKFTKLFGLLYFAINLVVFAVIFLLALNTANDVPAGFSPGWALLFFPAIGMVAGYWLYLYRFGMLRSIVMVTSFVITISGAFIVIFVVPKIENQPMHAQESSKLKPPDEITDRFFKAVDEQDLAFVRNLLDQGIDMDVVDESQSTALHLTHNKKIMQLLLDRGADIEARDDLGLTPIFYKDVHLAKLLVTAGADINARSSDGNTPFMWHCYSGYLEGIKYLIERGADLNVCNSDGNNAKYIVEHFQPNTETFYYVMSFNIEDCK